ncbi:MAG: TonB family protein [Thermodesulfobacteriota bacterium]
MSFWEKTNPEWVGAILGSLLMHGLLLGSFFFWATELPPPRRVVPVEAICLVPGPKGGGSARAGRVKPAQAPAPLDTKKKTPRPKPLKVKQPQPLTPLAPSLALPRPAAPPAATTSRSSELAAVSGKSSGYGRSGGGAGTGPGTGSGAGRGSGSGPGKGTGEGGSILGGYLAQVRRLLEQHKNYPSLARRRHQQGVVVLSFTIGAGGQIESAGLRKSSGHMLLDQAAQETLRRVQRFPPLPPALGRTRLTIQVPLAFHLRDS